MLVYINYLGFIAGLYWLDDAVFRHNHRRAQRAYEAASTPEDKERILFAWRTGWKFGSARSENAAIRSRFPYDDCVKV